MPEPLYHERLIRMRDAFPAPVSDRKHDAYFVFSIMRALDRIDAMKSQVPLLGRPRALDYAAAGQAARGAGVHLSMTGCYRETDYGEPIVGLKSFILSPFVDEEHVRDVLDARRAMGPEPGGR